MKKILLLFVTSSITTATVVPTTLKFNDTNLPNTIFNSVNYKFHKDNPNGKTNTFEEISLFSYGPYSQTWSDFITHYQTLSFLNFDASAGGSGSQYDDNAFMIKTNRLMTYSSIICHYSYSDQDITISLKFQAINGYVYAIAEILSNNSTNDNIWATLQIGSVIIY